MTIKEISRIAIVLIGFITVIGLNVHAFNDICKNKNKDIINWDIFTLLTIISDIAAIIVSLGFWTEWAFS